MSSQKNLTVFIPKDILDGETRCSATTKTIKAIIKKGFNVIVEKGAGEKASITDDDFKQVGAKIEKNIEQGYKKADIILAMNTPNKNPETKKHQIDMIRENTCWVSLFIPQMELETVDKMRKKKITAFSLNLIPRTTRAQSMDVLSSQANIAGYKAVLMAADKLGKIFPLMMTAAGTIKPAKVVIMGIGVAGLQAIGTAKRLGAQVFASDIRRETKEQAESLGAKFIEVESDEDLTDEGGYVKEASKEYLAKQAQEVAKHVASSNVVITTALIPGRKAPILIKEEMVKSMPKGSVIVDMAASMGGNCELTESGKTVEKHGVYIIGETNIPSLVPIDTTAMFAKNLENFLFDFIKEGQLNIDMENEIIAGSLVTHEGKVIHKPTEDLLLKKK